MSTPRDPEAWSFELESESGLNPTGRQNPRSEVYPSMIDRDKGSYDYMHPTLSSTKSANRLAYVCLTMGGQARGSLALT